MRPVYVGRLPHRRAGNGGWGLRVWLVLTLALVGWGLAGPRAGLGVLAVGGCWRPVGGLWWRGVRLAAERLGGRSGDVLALAHAWRWWPVLAPHLGLATVDPGTTRQLVAARGGRTGALVLDPGRSQWIVVRLVFRLTPWGFTATGRLVAGMVPEDFTDRTGALVHAWYVHAVRVDSPARGWVRLTALRRDPLAVPVPALAVADAPDLAALPVGRREDGRVWTVRLLGRHVLIAGSTGAGKGSVQWSLIRALCPLLAAGVVQMWTADPKRMEFPAGLRLFARYAADPDGIVGMVEDAARVLDARAGQLAGGHPPAHSERG